MSFCQWGFDGEGAKRGLKGARRRLTRRIDRRLLRKFNAGRFSDMTREDVNKDKNLRVLRGGFAEISAREVG